MAQKKPGTHAAENADPLFNLESIKDFMRFFEKVDIAEVELTVKDKSLTLSKKSRATAPAPMPAMEQRIMAPAPEAPKPVLSAAATKAAEKAARPANIVEIKSPIVGTFYRSREPGAAPFVKVGDSVESGKLVCLIEAMKVFNEIKSEIRGTITEVCIENEQPVEFGQALFLVETK